jgi:proteasome assembly chaperone (PAC2) family protein
MLRVEDHGPFVTPALIVAMDGWVNAGSAGTLVAETLAADAEVIARFDSDQLYDYRMLRPTITFRDGVITEVEWPEMSIRRLTLDGRDLLVLSGPEPNWRWHELADTLVDASVGWGVVEYIAVGGVPWAVPHTRPVSIMTTSTTPERLQSGTGAPEGTMEVPGAAVSAVEHRFHQRGLATIGFWARIPNYVGSAFPSAAEALIERLSGHLGVEFDRSDLGQRGIDQLAHLDSLIDGRPDVRSMVTQLEEIYDSTSVISGDDLAAQIEQFLRDQR